ncbi:MAG: enoyl-CoA hydratase/isomerase family protein [Chloroflexi bacterium]|nr:enoyl-CoA hydratase/isomerase family protein [Chloroflexota bacterium]
MPPFQTILYSKEGPLAYITLNRPQALNAVSIQMRDELYAVLGSVAEDPDVQAVILQGVGERAFCAGADISEFGTAPSRAIARRVRWQRDLWGLFLAQEKPLIAAIHGYALGAGVEMALCCDLRVASEEAQFGLPEVGLGMVPTAGGTQTLPRHIPLGKAMEMVLLGDRIGAGEALRLGLVNRVVPRPRLLPTAQEMASRILSLSPVAVRLAKAAVVRGLDLSLEAGLALESRLLAQALTSQDAREGVQSVLEGRPPHFQR